MKQVPAIVLLSAVLSPAAFAQVVFENASNNGFFVPFNTSNASTVKYGDSGWLGFVGDGTPTFTVRQITLSLAVATVQAELADHEVHSVPHRPGDGVTVGYRVWLRTASGDLVEDYVLLSSTAGRDVPDDAAHVVSMQGPSGRLLGWRSRR